MKPRGLTLTELLVAVTIIAAAATMVWPLIRGARDSTRDVSCMDKLRQIHVAISLYRSDYDGEGIYGNAYSMGLPPSGTATLYLTERLSLEMIQCSGRPLPSGARNAFKRMYEVPDKDETVPPWADYCRLMQNESVLIVDLNHGDTARPAYSTYTTHRGIGLYLGGNIRVVVKQGSPGMKRWWN
ncbi:MAG: prepilin-type N-terminal cleavage/methylation domain-containing protein [Armatimonadetes bacterium]|nr:prepilin-type N-terminal cleavage/methylation domain-containing protein [Armatimonadota bacterium]